MGRLVELSLTECLELLYRGVVGRVGFGTPMGPRIVPVNYSMYHGDVVFRTTPDSELATYCRNHLAVFEIDGFDRDEQQGWSVVAKGSCGTVDDPVLVNEIGGSSDPQPWASGHRHVYLRLAWDVLTGRRIELDPSLPRRPVLVVPDVAGVCPDRELVRQGAPRPVGGVERGEHRRDFRP